MTVVAGPITPAEIWAALAEVPDPEIPLVSIVDLGIVRAVTVTRLPSPEVADGRADAPGGIARGIEASDGPDRVRVELLPTFVGCPALEVMREAVRERLELLAPGAEVAVEFTFAEPWSTERITPTGRDGLRRSGFAPPETQGPGQDPRDASGRPRDLALLQLAPAMTCPHCGSRRTRLENAFGPALCRAIYHCAACRQPFEALKAV
ncbi:MAG: 1,2-phenylacetyl-CoA epoxidase subunit PaaD [Candidatus Limnocylindrales bacterium]